MHSWVFILLQVLQVMVVGATENAPSETLLEKFPVELQINEVLSLKAKAHHHFNLEAPQDCAGAKPEFDVTATEATCQWDRAGVRQVVVSLCDDGNTFCRQQKVQVTVNDPSGESLPIRPQAVANA